MREISDARAFDRPISSLDYDIERFHRSSTDARRKYIYDAIAFTIMRDDHLVIAKSQTAYGAPFSKDEVTSDCASRVGSTIVGQMRLRWIPQHDFPAKMRSCSTIFRPYFPETARFSHSQSHEFVIRRATAERARVPIINF